MPFMVIYDKADGTSGREEAEAIDEAAHFVERLRNDESVDQIRLFRMEEIPFEFRPYYKVELGLPPRMASAAGLTRPSEPVLVHRPAPSTPGAASGLFRR